MTAVAARGPAGAAAARSTGMATRTAHLAALWAFALVQPLFGLLGRNAEFFVAHRDTALDIVLFALGFALLPPAALALAEWLVARVAARAAWGLHLALVAVLAGLVALPPAGDLLGASALAVVPAGLVGAAAAALYARARAVRSFATALSPALALFVVILLVFSPVSKLVFGGGDAEAAGGVARSSTPVVMVVLDELPLTTLLGAGGRIDARRFPHLAELAEHSTWYRNATTVADGTPEAVPALLTGSRPRRGDLPTAGDHPHSLFTFLARSHDLHVIEPITDVCPQRLCGEERPGMASRLRLLASDVRVVSLHLLLPGDLRDGLPPVDREWEGFGEDERPPRPTAGAPLARQRAALLEQTLRRLDEADPRLGFARMIAGIRPLIAGDRPPLYFLHAALPHATWRYLPDGRQYAIHRSPLPGYADGDWVGPQWLVDQSFQRHLLQTQLADRLVGRLIARLRAARLYDRALIVLTADHGVSLRSGASRRTVERASMPDIASVPLFVKAPGRHAGRVDDAAVRSIDVLPTIAALLGTRLPWRVDGVPAGERNADPATPIDVSHQAQWRITMPFGELLRRRAERERYEERLLGDRRSLYALGPDRELVGRRLAALGVERAADGERAVLDGPAEVATGNDGPGLLQVYVSGTVSGLAPGDAVAVAVDGRVRATTRVRMEDDEPVFSAMVPPRALRGGDHAVGVYRVLGGGRLRPLTRPGSP